MVVVERLELNIKTRTIGVNGEIYVEVEVEKLSSK
jgi:hypothetical protein